MKKALLISFLLVSVAGISSGQSVRQFKKQLYKEIKYFREGKLNSINVSDYQAYIAKFPAEVLRETEQYAEDSLYGIRSFAGDVYFWVAKESKDTSVRHKAIYLMAKQCSDKDQNLRERASNHLKEFSKQDFDSLTRRLLASYFKGSPDIYRYTARLAGYLDMEAQIPVIKQLLTDSLSNRVKWELELTLARLGDDDAAYYCTNFVMMQGINDRIIQYLFRDLIYTRSRIAFDYIIEELYDNQLNCRPANPYSSKSIVCGYRIMELLAPVIKDYPYKIYTSTGQLKTEDYDKALKNVRIWFKNNPNYVIKTNRF